MAENKKKDQENETPEINTGTDTNTFENISDNPETTESDSAISRLTKLQAELEDANDKYLRKVAEFENFKRRNAKERIELIQTAGKEVIIELLDVLDDCDRAQKQLEQSNDPNEIKEGIMLVFNKLRSILQARGLKAMDSLNQEFNTDLHEAITEIPAPNEDLKNRVLDEVIKGYFLNDKIIRYAKVVVGK